MSAASVGTAKLGVPMKTTRTSLSDARELLRLHEAFDYAVTLEPRKMIDEEHAVEMIDFMLNAGRENSRRVHLSRLSGAIEKPDLHVLRTADHVEEVRNR